MKQVVVQSAVIDWQAETLTITDKDNGKHVVPLDDIIHVTMEGEKEKHMKAGVLGEYMSNGYIIQQIRYKDADEIKEEIADWLRLQREGTDEQ